MPAWNALNLSHEDVNMAVPTYKMPSGSLKEDSSHPRSAWTCSMSTPVNTWLTDNTLKYTEREMAARAAEGARITREIENERPIDIGRDGSNGATYSARARAINKKHLELGVKGIPVFNQLSYFKYGRVWSFLWRTLTLTHEDVAFDRGITISGYQPNSTMLSHPNLICMVDLQILRKFYSEYVGVFPYWFNRHNNNANA